MNVGIMQPYLFPYLGYFQLINMVDTFVIHDDIQYIKKGWINRNKILLNGKEYLFTFSVKKDHYYKNINERFYSEEFIKQGSSFLKTVELSYRKAPYFTDVFKLLNDILNYEIRNVSIFNTNSIVEICKYMGIETPIIFSSELKKNDLLKGQERVLDINKKLGSKKYINPIGGMELYSKDVFESNNIKLNFICKKDIKYDQYSENFIDNLSIIDVLMFNSKSEIQNLLGECELI